MAVILPHYFVVTPRVELLERVTAHLQQCVTRDAPCHEPWFAERHVWWIPSAGNHDYSDGVKDDAIVVRLCFLASIHEELFVAPPRKSGLFNSCLACHQRVESFVHGLLGREPTDWTRFDALWTIDFASVFARLAAPELLSVAALAQVRGPTHRRTPERAYYVHELEPVDAWRQQWITTRAFAVSELQSVVAWAIRTLDRRFVTQDLERSVAITIQDLAQDDAERVCDAAVPPGWRRAPRATLQLEVDRPTSDMRVRFSVRKPHPTSRSRSVSLHSGAIDLILDNGKIISATLETHVREELRVAEEG